MDNTSDDILLNQGKNDDYGAVFSRFALGGNANLLFSSRYQTFTLQCDHSVKAIFPLETGFTIKRSGELKKLEMEFFGRSDF